MKVLLRQAVGPYTLSLGCSVWEEQVGGTYSCFWYCAMSDTTLFMEGFRSAEEAMAAGAAEKLKTVLRRICARHGIALPRK